MSSILDESEEMRLASTKTESRDLTSLGELYAIVQTTEQLEVAFLQGSIPAADYTNFCSDLIARFEAHSRLLLSSKTILSTDEFFNKYCSASRVARHRLLVAKKPETIENNELWNNKRGYRGQEKPKLSGSAIIKLTGVLSGLIDAIKVYTFADELLPFISGCRNEFLDEEGIPNDWDAITRLGNWEAKLRALPATAKLTDEDMRQLSHEVEAIYSDWTQMNRSVE